MVRSNYVLGRQKPNGLTSAPRLAGILLLPGLGDKKNDDVQEGAEFDEWRRETTARPTASGGPRREVGTGFLSRS